ncbi:cytochrome b561/ferric reductase transmembrane with DOMON related domain-containing protein [Actinidia rufa]|uniref:Cytochrome b561/ferric reductase transmembrane with DOMON related domain-containing protein n=1 Tax=Actinidia rufa TaxID=165716 RepID=A0A7J0HAI0_9ERIC|nr:cytochrome b561/ferric reductase transmembrane with DOMON related domain-containing protein [Actinidia rufa]
MKTSSIFIVFFLIYGLASSVNSQTDSCSSNLNLNSQIKFDTASLNCNPVWTAQDYILRYAQAGPKLWSFVLSAPNTNAYVAIGFSPNGNMVGSSAIVGWVAADGVAHIKQYSLTGRSPPQVLPDQGNLDILGNSSSVVSESSRLYVAFQLSTDLPENRLLYAVGPIGVFPTAPNFRLTEHNNKVSTTLNYVTAVWYSFMQMTARSNSNTKKSVFQSEKEPWDLKHVGMGDSNADWSDRGSIFQAMGSNLKNKLSANVNMHKGLGIFILILGCLQVMAFLARPEKVSKYRKYWNCGWNAGFAVVLVGLFIVATVLEIRMRMKK